MCMRVKVKNTTPDGDFTHAQPPPFAPTDLEIHLRVHVTDVINRAKFLKIGSRVSDPEKHPSH